MGQLIKLQSLRPSTVYIKLLHTKSTVFYKKLLHPKSLHIDDG